ncbi:MAG TPA: hypothetical protein QF870_11255, partial [Nitrospinota bacterium]|nr:hypothetical protein [Nitrospinota bacterium]
MRKGFSRQRLPDDGQGLLQGLEGPRRLDADGPQVVRLSRPQDNADAAGSKLRQGRDGHGNHCRVPDVGTHRRRDDGDFPDFSEKGHGRSEGVPERNVLGDPDGIEAEIIGPADEINDSRQ